MQQLAQKLSQEIEKLEGVKSKKNSQQISYSHRAPFAAIRIKKDLIELDFTTPSKINHSRLKDTKALKVNKIRHTIIIKKESDIDPQVLGWLQIAHATN